MKIWIGFEATSDVTESNGTEYAAFESALNNELTTLENDYTIHLILIIMNAEIAPPFPEGYIFRKTKKSYDCKLHVPFDKWMMDDGILRWNLLADAARKAISSIKINQIDDEIRASAFAAVDLVRGQRMAGTGAPFPTP